jgi:hypothetical protein
MFEAKGTVVVLHNAATMEGVDPEDIAIEAGAEDVATVIGEHGTVRVFRHIFALEDAIRSHACSLEANMRVTNGIPLGSPLLLPVDTVNCVATRKAKSIGSSANPTSWVRWLVHGTSSLFG